MTKQMNMKGINKVNVMKMPMIQIMMNPIHRRLEIMNVKNAHEDKCVPCIMLIALEDLNTSYGSYEVEEESIEAIMAKAKAFDL